MRVVALVPAYNEADRIAATVVAASALFHVGSVLVIDDGSSDTTAERARAAGATVLRRPRNGGKAAALEAGIRDVLDSVDVVLLLDADLGATAGQAGCLLEPVVRGEADMTLATFPVIPGRGGGMGLVLRLARWGVRRLTGVELKAPLSGQRAATRAAIAACLPLAPGFGVETAMDVRVLRAGLRLLEVETAMDHRVTQNDWRGLRHRARQLRDVARALWRVR